MSFTRPDKLSFLRFRSLRMTLLALVLLSLTLGSAGQELRVKRGEAPDQAGEDEIRRWRGEGRALPTWRLPLNDRVKQVFVRGL